MIHPEVQRRSPRRISLENFPRVRYEEIGVRERDGIGIMQRLARFFIVHRVGNLQGATTEVPVGTGGIGVVRRRQTRTVVAAVAGGIRGRGGSTPGILTTHFAVETQSAVRSALCRAVGFKGRIGKKSRQFLRVRLGGLAAAKPGKVTHCAEEMGSAQCGRPGAVRIVHSDGKNVRPGFIRGEHRFDKFNIFTLEDFFRGIIISRAAGAPDGEGQCENHPYPF